MEMPPEVVDLATGTLRPQAPVRAQRTWRRPQEDL